MIYYIHSRRTFVLSPTERIAAHRTVIRNLKTRCTVLYVISHMNINFHFVRVEGLSPLKKKKSETSTKKCKRYFYLKKKKTKKTKSAPFSKINWKTLHMDAMSPYVTLSYLDIYIHIQNSPLVEFYLRMHTRFKSEC